MSCPCNLTQEKILELNREHIVRLGEGGRCDNPAEDGVSPCGRLLRDHPSERDLAGYKMNSIPLYHILTVMILLHDNLLISVNSSVTSDR